MLYTVLFLFFAYGCPGNGFLYSGCFLSYFVSQMQSYMTGVDALSGIKTPGTAYPLLNKKWR